MLVEAGLELLDYRGTLFLPFGGISTERLDGLLARMIGRGPMGQLGLRQFYVCKASG
jgi:hypothetical protein